MQIDVNEVFTLYRTNYRGMCSEIISVVVLKINKQSYSCKNLSTGEKINISFGKERDSDYNLVYKQGSFDGYDIANYDDEERLRKECQMLKKLEEAKKSQLLGWFNIKCKDEDLDKMKEEAKRLNDLISKIENGRKTEKEMSEKIDEYVELLQNN
ncbi:MAG: hypothetical protein ACRC7S_17845 [Cetobacterium sp.]